MSEAAAVRGVHLVGSLPLGNAEEVFDTVAHALPHHVRRIPDGETGDRQQWIQFQLGVLSSRPEFEVITNESLVADDLPPTLRLRDGHSPYDVDFSDLGYAEVARDSFAIFERMQFEGRIPSELRFQVSLPTPLANATTWMQSDPSFPVLYERYTQAMLDELRMLLDSIPHDRLAIQWDVCFEVLMFEGWVQMPEGIDRQAISEHLVRISEAVPDDVQLGYHFCFGDFRHVHVREPDDTQHVVELINSFIGLVSRPITWIHIPVPIERDDDAYFEPLRRLGIAAGTEVYLGLIHYRDGVEGARRRTATARRFVPAFGVATECGMGRRPPGRGGTEDTLAHLLSIHAQIAQPVHTS
jgi:methionine synthase II (cobalamin-independent)